MPTQSLISSKVAYKGGPFENMLRDCFSCGVIAVDFEGRIISVNPEAKRVLHLPALREPAPSLETLPAQITAIIREVLRTGKTTANRKITLNFLKQASATLSVTAMPVSGRPGASVVAMLNDFSAAEKLEKNLRRLDRLASVGTLSAGLAHEIKNALVAVKTFVDLLLEKNQDAELSETVRREIGRMDAILSHMLKYATAPKPALAKIRLHEVLEHSLHMMHPRIGAKMISLKREFNAADDQLTGDDHQLEQALLNLLFNAVDAIGTEGELTVGTDLLDDDKKNRQLRIRITDTGDGIPAKTLPEIFKPFFTTKSRGTGLGLAVTRRIIEEHGGVISVESRAGKGTTFTILLPTETTPAD